MIWSELYHFRVSGSTPAGQLLCSFTETIRVAAAPLQLLGVQLILLATLGGNEDGMGAWEDKLIFGSEL